MPGDLNQYGFLFGGRMLSWVDEACWIAASLDYPNSQFVTVGSGTVLRKVLFWRLIVIRSSGGARQFLIKWK